MGVPLTPPVFARHETFHPRYSWLKKGFDQAVADHEIFVDPEAHVRLGVGKNMVRAIRYWCHAFKVLEDDPSVGGRATGSKPSAFGEFLLDDAGGLDPFLEDPSSLWLLHWKLLSEPCEATAWWYAFFVHAGGELSPRELATDLNAYVGKHFPTARAAESSLKKDASCIVRMYGVVPTGSAASEETIQCPFAELGILRPGSKKGTYLFKIGRKPGLTPKIIAAASLDFASRHVDQGRRTIDLSRLVHQPGSPGLAFKLTETALYHALEEVAEQDNGIQLSEAAGLVQLSYADDPADLSRQLLTAHYEDRVEAVV
jgi:hypothetical protein